MISAGKGEGDDSTPPNRIVHTPGAASGLMVSRGPRTYTQHAAVNKPATSPYPTKTGIKRSPEEVLLCGPMHRIVPLSSLAIFMVGTELGQE